MNNCIDYRMRITGLGGQGVMTIASVIMEAALCQGFEVTGLDKLRSAMRLGPVSCDIRILTRGFRPTLPPGTVQGLIATEEYEGITSAGMFLKEGGTGVVDTRQTMPITRIVKREPYASVGSILNVLENRGVKLVRANASAISKRVIGHYLGANFVLLGVFLRSDSSFPLSSEYIIEQIKNEPTKLACLQAGFEIG